MSLRIRKKAVTFQQIGPNRPFQGSSGSRWFQFTPEGRVIPAKAPQAPKVGESPFRQQQATESWQGSPNPPVTEPLNREELAKQAEDAAMKLGTTTHKIDPRVMATYQIRGKQAAEKVVAAKKTPPAMLPNPSSIKNKRKEDALKETLSNGDILEFDEIDPQTHANGAYMVKFSDDLFGVFKPESGEKVDRNDIPKHTGYVRECAAFSIAQWLGLSDMVPVTGLRTSIGPESSQNELGKGSVQFFVRGGTSGFRLANWSEVGSTEDIARAAFFDYLICNTDRRAGNFLRTGVDSKDNNGRLVLIDHGLSIPTGYFDIPYIPGQLTEFVSKAAKDMLPIPDASNYRGKWGELQKILDSHYIEPEAIALMKERFEALTSGKYRDFSQLPMWGTKDTLGYRFRKRESNIAD